MDSGLKPAGMTEVGIAGMTEVGIAGMTDVRIVGIAGARTAGDLLTISTKLNKLTIP